MRIIVQIDSFDHFVISEIRVITPQPLNIISAL